MSATLEAQLRLDLAQYQGQLAKARSEAKKFRDQLASDGRGKGGSVIESLMGDVKGMLPAVGVAATVTGIKSIIGSYDDLVDAALRLNESTETLQRVEYASKLLASVDMDGLVGSFLKLEKALGDVENKAASNALARYGVSAETLARAPLDQKILLMAEAFQRSRTEGHGYNDVLALLGKSAGELIPMFEQSRESIQELFNDAVVVDDASVQRMAALNDQIDGFLARQKSKIAEIVGIGAMIVDDILDPNKSLGDNMSQASASADKGEADRQKRRDDAAKGQAEARAKAEAEKAAAEAVKDQAKAKQELQSLMAKEQAMNEKRFADYLSILPPNLKLIELRREMLRLEQQRESLVGPGLDEQRLATETQILDIRRQTRQAEGDIADEQKRAAEEAKAAAEKQGSQDSALAEFQAEMDLIAAKLKGNKDLVKELERQAEVQQIMNRLMDDAGLSEADAAKRAEEMVKAKEDLAKKEDKGDKITGYSRGRQGGVEEARQRAEDRVAKSREGRDQAVKDSFGTIRPDAKADTANNPLAPQAGRNAAADAAQNGIQSSSTGTPEQAAQIVIQSLPQILSVLTGASS